VKSVFFALGFLRLFTLKALLPSSGSSSLFLIVPTFWSRHSPQHRMKNTRKCKACERPFVVDHRSSEQHAFCARAACQRRRRSQAQRHRRRTRRSVAAGNEAIRVRTRLQGTVKPSEAAIHLQNPLFIGLISMITGSTDLEEIQQVARKAYQQGRNILGLGSNGEPTNPTEQTG
jgi:hypothetical protein